MNQKIYFPLTFCLFLSLYGASECSHGRAVRKPGNAVSEIFLNRTSPRAMSGEAITYEELQSLFEAARWAPSSYNGQPWRFVYARRGTKAFDMFFDLLVDFNKQWCKNAGALVVIVSRETFEWNNQPNMNHSFDTGAAWENLALQGSMKGLVVHGMSGFDFARAKKALRIPEGYSVQAMFAVGKPGKVEDLPEAMRAQETPSDRKKVEEFAFEGMFKQ